MARITYVKKSQKPQGNCGFCGKPIEVGTSYMWVKPSRFDRTMKRHAGCKVWSPSEMATNEKTAAFLAVFEVADEAAAEATTAEELRDILTTAAESLREVGQMYADSAQAVEDGFGHSTTMSEELQEKADALESAADELESAADDIEDGDDVEWVVYDADGDEVARFDTEEAAEARWAELNEPFTDAPYTYEATGEPFDLDGAVDTAQNALGDAQGAI